MDKNMSLDEAWGKLVSSHPDYRRTDFLDDRFSISSLGLNGFQPISAAELLTSDKRSYFAHKEAVFSAYVSWVLSPTNDLLRRRSLEYAVRRKMVSVEKSVLISESPDTLAADFVSRYWRLGPRFFSELYLPIGGLSAIAKTSGSWVRDSFLRDTKHLMFAIQVARIYHYVVMAEGLRVPSLNTAAKIFGGLDLKEVTPADTNERQVKEYWANHRSTIALTYAASSIVHRNGTSLLEHLKSGRATYSNTRSSLSKWFGRATWFASSVLNKCYEKNTASVNSAVLPRSQPEAFGYADFTLEQEAFVDRNFKELSSSEVGRVGQYGMCERRTYVRTTYTILAVSPSA